MKSRRNSFNAIQGLWIPEHVRIAILENLRAEHGSDRKQKTMLLSAVSTNGTDLRL